MKLPRFTIRRLMVATAIVAVVFGVYGWTMRRSTIFRREAAKHLEDTLVLGPFTYFPNDSEPRAAYHWALAEKYSRAARYPWLPVAPDPPEPE
jgi:hypothetical protein